MCEECNCVKEKLLKQISKIKRDVEELKLNIESDKKDLVNITSISEYHDRLNNLISINEAILIGKKEAVLSLVWRYKRL